MLGHPQSQSLVPLNRPSQYSPQNVSDSPSVAYFPEKNNKNNNSKNNGNSNNGNDVEFTLNLNCCNSLSSIKK